MTNVVVSGTGLSTGNAILYADRSWAKTNASLVDGTHTYTATGYDTYGRTAADSVTVDLPDTVSFSYDANGNLINDNRRVFEYDYENQLTNVYVASAWKSEFRYDAFGRKRIQKEYTWTGSAWALTNEIRYIYDGMLVVQERNSSNIPQVTYTRGVDLNGELQRAGGIGGLLSRTENALALNPQVAFAAHSYYHADGNGNITCMVNTNGSVVARYSYDPYGNMLGMDGPLASVNSYRFSSKEWHNDAGLYYYGYRFYEPNLQRWLNKDPIGERGGLNIFRYAEHNPIDLFDPFGLASPQAACGVAIATGNVAKMQELLAVAGEIGLTTAQQNALRNAIAAATAAAAAEAVGGSRVEQQGRRETGVKTTTGDTKADAKANGERRSSESGNDKKPKQDKVDLPEQPDPLRGRREHYDKDMPPKDGAPARPSTCP